jgi:hypothetical protein
MQLNAMAAKQNMMRLRPFSATLLHGFMHERGVRSEFDGSLADIVEISPNLHRSSTNNPHHFNPWYCLDILNDWKRTNSF